jgi:hypothetical protein
MRFKLGIAVGFAAGYWVATTSAEERRAKLDELVSGVRENPRLTRVADTVTRDVHRLGDAVEQRLAKVADGATGAVAHTVEPSDASTSSSGSTSSGTTSGTTSSGRTSPGGTKSSSSSAENRSESKSA